MFTVFEIKHHNLRNLHYNQAARLHISGNFYKKGACRHSSCRLALTKLELRRALQTSLRDSSTISKPPALINLVPIPATKMDLDEFLSKENDLESWTTITGPYFREKRFVRVASTLSLISTYHTSSLAWMPPCNIPFLLE